MSESKGIVPVLLDERDALREQTVALAVEITRLRDAMESIAGWTDDCEDREWNRNGTCLDCYPDDPEAWCPHCIAQATLAL